MRLASAAILIPMMTMMSCPAFAESHEGIVRLVQIDSDSETPLCVATSPDIPNGGWACVATNRRHYRDMMEMLFRAFDEKHTCTFELGLKDLFSGRPQIKSITCSTR